MSGHPPPRRQPPANLHILPECRDMIRRGAFIAINSSGGKDSSAMTILLFKVVPRDQLVAVHAPLGEIESPGTIEQFEDTIPAGIPPIFAPVASGKSLLERVVHTLSSPSRIPLPDLTGIPIEPASTPTFPALCIQDSDDAPQRVTSFAA